MFAANGALCESLMMGVGWDLAVMAGRETMVTVGADAALLTTARVAPVLLLRLSAGVTFGSPDELFPCIVESPSCEGSPT